MAVFVFLGHLSIVSRKHVQDDLYALLPTGWAVQRKYQVEFDLVHLELFQSEPLLDP